MWGQVGAGEGLLCSCGMGGGVGGKGWGEVGAGFSCCSWCFIKRWQRRKLLLLLRCRSSQQPPPPQEQQQEQEQQEQQQEQQEQQQQQPSKFQRSIHACQLTFTLVCVCVTVHHHN